MIITVRDGQKVWPTCAECGCRLQKAAGYWIHFIGEVEGKDARGCICKYVNSLWKIDD